MSAKELSRNIPAGVRRTLRKEVNYGCPVKSCGSPFLSYHHYNPPWHVEKHHNIEGMIALCLHHHKSADNGAFTNEQLDNLKENPFLSNDDILGGEITWKRDNILFDIGGNYFLGATKIHLKKEEKLVWIEFDEDGHIMINLNIKDKDGNLLFTMRNNDWLISTSLQDIESPPAMKMVKFRDDDKNVRLSVEYKAHSLESFIREYQTILPNNRIYELLNFLPQEDIVICKIRGLLQYPFHIHFKDGRTDMKNLKGPFTINSMMKLAEGATMEYGVIVDYFEVGDGIIVK